MCTTEYYLFFLYLILLLLLLIVVHAGSLYVRDDALIWANIPNTHTHTREHALSRWRRWRLQDKEVRLKWAFLPRRGCVSLLVPDSLLLISSNGCSSSWETVAMQKVPRKINTVPWHTSGIILTRLRCNHAGGTGWQIVLWPRRGGCWRGIVVHVSPPQVGCSPKCYSSRETSPTTTTTGTERRSVTFLFHSH